jgi:hypothetical protein
VLTGQKHPSFPKLIELRRRLAQVAIGASTVRGQREPGLAEAVRTFLASLKLSQFGVQDEKSFQEVLNKETGNLLRKRKLRKKWGVARKCLNIFLRDAFYNVYLRTEYGLEAAEQWYEVPLDSQVAKALEARAKEWSPREALPRWTTIKDLQPEESKCYQAFAKQVAESEGLPGRVHLDLLYFRAQKLQYSLMPRPAP